jgi:hypothetical protein
VIGATVVMVDGAKESGFSALKSITASQVDEVRYLDPSRSLNEYGPQASGGAVVVKRKKLDKPVPKPPRDSLSF